MAKTSKANVLKSVLKTLSAVRRTMSSEEQRILDSIVVYKVEGDEVIAHALQSKSSVSKAAQAKAAQSKITASATEDEVMAHALQSKSSVSKAAQTKAAQTKIATSVVVYFDTESGEYKALNT